MKIHFFILFLIQFFVIPSYAQNDKIISFEDCIGKDIYFHNINLHPLSKKAIFVMINGKLKPYTKSNVLYKNGIFSCCEIENIKDKKYLIFKNSEITYYFLINFENQTLLDYMYNFSYIKNEYKYYDITQDPNIIYIDKSLLKYNRCLKINWDNTENGIFTYHIYSKEFKESYDDLKNKIIKGIFVNDKKLQEYALEEDIKYRENSKWQKLKLYTNLYCNVCHKEHSFYLDWTLKSINNDTIYYTISEPNDTFIGEKLDYIHYSKIDEKLKTDDKFIKHCRIWKDSINSYYTNKIANFENNNSRLKFLNKIKNKFNEINDKLINIAPYGFFSNCELKKEDIVNGIEPHFSYVNTASNTIKYIDFYFSLKNDVGDPCCLLSYKITYQGKLRGVGPVEPNEMGVWNWEYPIYYTSPDASKMNIDKLVITYMNGSVKTIQEKDIIYLPGIEEEYFNIKRKIEDLEYDYKLIGLSVI